MLLKKFTKQSGVTSQAEHGHRKGIDEGFVDNKVPNNIKKVEEYKPYKRKLKSFLTEHAFYSLDEFLRSG